MQNAIISIIGESINDSVPSTHTLFEADDRESLKKLAIDQGEQGAAYIDVNIGLRSPEFMGSLVRELQTVSTKPLSIDSPDPAIAEAGLAACDPSRGVPILNSISPLRLGMFNLARKYRFRPILLISEGLFDGEARACRTAEETYATAKFMLAEAHKAGLANDDCLFDPGIAPIASDGEGNLKRLLDSMRLIRDDPAFAGIHYSVGLSNFTVMLPPRRKDGSPIKSDLESAFLTLAIPLGQDHVIGSVKRRYRILEPDHPAMQCVEDCIRIGGIEAIMRATGWTKSTSPCLL